MVVIVVVQLLSHVCTQLHGLQHIRLPYPSPSPRTCLNSCPLILWYHSTISSSIISFSPCLQPFPLLGSFPVSQLFVSGSQSIRVSVSASVLPVSFQGWLPLGLTGLISLLSKGFLFWPNFLTNPFGKICFSLSVGYTTSHFLLTPVFQLSLL